jgi:hypothetical protein
MDDMTEAECLATIISALERAHEVAMDMAVMNGDGDDDGPARLRPERRASAVATYILDLLNSDEMEALEKSVPHAAACRVHAVPPMACTCHRSRSVR